jgi:3-oxoacyl-[acyl-carrier-protein] synthase II
MKKRVVITGIGILCGNAKGRADYWQALREGRVGYRPISLFEVDEYPVKQAGEISDFDPKIYMGQKGLRTLDRSTTLVVSAAKLAIDDSQFQITPENTDDTGVAIGTTLGSVKSIADFDTITLREGPRAVNPALFPNTVINSPASQISIWHKIAGFNTTLSTGFCAAMDALQYAYDFIQWERASVIYAGGVEEFCLPTYLGFNAIEYLSGSKPNQEFVNCPFDKRRNGITLGEGACVIAVEEYEHAKARGAHIWAEILGFGYSFDPFKIHKFNPRGTGMKEAMTYALQENGLKPQDIDYICANANSTQAADKIETEAIKEVFGEYAYKIPVSAVKSMVGECYSVTGAFNVAAGVGAICEGFLFPTINYKEADPICDLDYVPNQSRPADLKHVMVNCFGPNGNNNCMVLKKYED